MGRKKAEYNKKQGEHLKAWLSLIDMSEQALAEILGNGYHQQTISRMKNSRPIRPEEAVAISEKTKYIETDSRGIEIERHVMPEYLLGKSNFMFDSPYNGPIHRQSETILKKHELAANLIEAQGYKIGTFSQWGNYDENGNEYADNLVSITSPSGKTVIIPLVKYNSLIQNIVDSAKKELLFIMSE